MPASTSNPEDIMSESIQMYLVTTALLQKDEQPVPLSLLASKLSITPVSANEMCRKLMERGLVEYQPYKGVTLTSDGKTLAQSVLSRRRLWEAFLVDKLGISPDESEDIACHLEHITSDTLIEHLKAFLAESPSTPAYDITSSAHASAEIAVQPLTTFTAGQHGQIQNIAANNPIKDFLHAQGVAPGKQIEVLIVGSDGSLLLNIAHNHISLSRTVANNIFVSPMAEAHTSDSLMLSDSTRSVEQ